MILNKIHYKIFFNYFQNKNKKIIEIIKQKKKIWHFCTPKSGSSFFSNYLRYQLEHNNKNFGFFKTTPQWEDRMQEICYFTISQEIKSYLYKNFFLSAHTHMTFNKSIESIFSISNDIYLVQYRGLLDTVVSLKNFIDSQKKKNYSIKNPWFQTNNWHLISDEEKFKCIIISFTPWFFNFLNSWSNCCKKNYNVYLLKYDDIVDDPKKKFFLLKNFLGNLKEVEYNKMQLSSKLHTGIVGNYKNYITNDNLNLVRTLLLNLNLPSKEHDKYLF